MPKIGRDGSTGKYTVTTKDGGKTVITNKKTGKQLAPKGYGALKDEYVVKEGIDLTKPIYEQAMKSKARTARSSTNVKRHKG
jgi:hypothetical protein